MERMAPRRHPLRNWIISMYQRGELATVAEGAIIGTVPRQTVARWIREAGIDIGATRLRYLARCQLKAERYTAGLPPPQRPSRAQMRRDLEKAMRHFNAANARPS
jgi:hypothetical protein